MSTTPYKDELIRVIAALGLPDDHPLDQVADAVTDLAGQLETARIQATGGAAAVGEADQLRSYLGRLQRDLRQAGQLVVANNIATALAKVRR